MKGTEMTMWFVHKLKSDPREWDAASTETHPDVHGDFEEWMSRGTGLTYTLDGDYSREQAIRQCYTWWLVEQVNREGTQFIVRRIVGVNHAANLNESWETGWFSVTPDHMELDPGFIAATRAVMAPTGDAAVELAFDVIDARQSTLCEHDYQATPAREVTNA